MDTTIHCTYTDDSQVAITTSGVQDVLHTMHDDSGRYVTPGDMLVAALGACTLTMIGAIAQRFHQKMDGATITLTPTFAPDMSGLKQVKLHITLPPDTPEDIRARCLAAAKQCPVHKSLNPNIEFIYTAN